jgi:hypothetical protein
MHKSMYTYRQKGILQKNSKENIKKLEKSFDYKI